MTTIDSYLEGLAHNSSSPLWMTLLIACLLGLRHASDPDHLTAVAALMVKDGARPRDAVAVGYHWGLGHCLTMLVFGLPVVLLSIDFSPVLYSAAEAAVGLVIIYYSIRLLQQYQAGRFHFHSLITASSRTSAKSFGVGTLHGVGGSYAAALLVLSTFESRSLATVGLIVFAVSSVLSMMLMSWVFSRMVTDHRFMHLFNSLLPALAFLSFAFGAFYLYNALL